MTKRSSRRIPKKKLLVFGLERVGTFPTKEWKIFGLTFATLREAYHGAGVHIRSLVEKALAAPDGSEAPLPPNEVGIPGENVAA